MQHKISVSLPLINLTPVFKWNVWGFIFSLSKKNNDAVRQNARLSQPLCIWYKMRYHPRYLWLISYNSQQLKKHSKFISSLYPGCLVLFQISEAESGWIITCSSDMNRKPWWLLHYYRAPPTKKTIVRLTQLGYPWDKSLHFLLPPTLLHLHSTIMPLHPVLLNSPTSF